MKKTPLILGVVVGLFLLFIILVIAEINGKKPHNWHPTYSKLDKNPYGCKLVKDALPALFPNKRLGELTSSIFKQYEEEVLVLTNNLEAQDEEENNTNDDSNFWFEIDSLLDSSSITSPITDTSNIQLNDAFYDELETLALTDDHKKFNVIYIGNNFYLNDFDRKALLFHVYSGNHAFITSNTIDAFQPFLKIPISQMIVAKSDSISILYDDHEFPLKNYTGESYFNVIETEDIKVLAKNNFDQPVLLKINYGKGAFILSSTPIVFTNYHLLHADNQKYLSKTLSHLPVEDTYWGNEYRSFENSSSGYSYFQFIMSEPALKWALILAISTMVIFMLFGMKRRQRLIPLYQLPTNKTIEYIETMSQLYLQRGEKSNIARKKVTFFYDYIRSKFKLNPIDKKEDFYTKLSEQTQIDQDRLKHIFAFTHELATKEKVSDEELLALNKTVDKFINETQK